MPIKYSLDRNTQRNLCAEISRNLYVDNMILLADDIPSGIKKYHGSKSIFEEMSIDLRGFVTNSEAIRSHF